MQVSEEIKSRLDIVDLIREYIPSLKAVGVNFVALSPFKREKTPSFVVSPEKQIWHCFSSGKGGDIFSFVMEMEGITFVEALRMLAPKAGVTLRKENKEFTSKRNRILDIMDLSVNFYHKNLLQSPEAEQARNYLKERGLTLETVMEWQIGYSPDSWDDLINTLKTRGLTDNEIFLSGMSVRKDHSSSRFYNRFRDRIMFPINDFSGSTVAFTARVNPAKEATEVMGKYVNSPQTMIYDKSKVLFGLDKAKQAIREEGLAIVVEGQMDVITAHQNGFKNVVASSGTALTSEQLKLIKRYTQNIALSFDMDEAGQMAAERGIKEAMSEEMNVKIITVPEGKDPDDFIKKNPEGWRKCVAESKHVVEYYLNKEKLEEASLEDKLKSADKLLIIISNLKNNIEKDHWIRILSEKTSFREEELRTRLVHFSSQPDKLKMSKNIAIEQEAQRRKEIHLEPETREEKLSQALLAVALRFPAYLNYIVNSSHIDYIFGASNKIFYKNLIIYYNNVSPSSTEGSVDFEYGHFREWLKNKLEMDKNNILPGTKEAQLKLLDKLVVLGDRDFFELDIATAKNEIIKLNTDLKKGYYNLRKKELGHLIAIAERERDDARLGQLFQELKTMSDEANNI